MGDWRTVVRYNSNPRRVDYCINGEIVLRCTPRWVFWSVDDGKANEICRWDK